MRQDREQPKSMLPASTLLAFALQCLVFWVLVWLFEPTAVAGLAWAALFAMCSVGTVVLARRAQRRPSAQPQALWLSVAFYSMFIAGIFAAAEPALDRLHGAGRAKTQVAQYIGGMELWYVLCPGIFSTALALSVGSAIGRRAVRFKESRAPKLPCDA